MSVVQGYSRDARLANFPWNASWFVTWRFCVTREEPEFLTDIRDFTTLFYVILGRKSSEWLESSVESDLTVGVRFAIRALT